MGKIFDAPTITQIITDDLLAHGWLVEAHAVLILKEAAAVEVQKLVKQFAENADKVVSGSYAARLAAAPPV